MLGATCDMRHMPLQPPCAPLFTAVKFHDNLHFYRQYNLACIDQMSSQSMYMLLMVVMDHDV